MSTPAQGHQRKGCRPRRAVAFGLIVAALSAGCAPEAEPAGAAVPATVGDEAAAAAAPATPREAPAAGSEAPGASSEAPAAAVPQTTGVEIVRSYPHDPGAFTQGLVYHGGYLYEGTGRRGASSLRQVEVETGRVVRRVDLPAPLFGEGIAVAGDRVYQLTWTSGMGFVYDLETFELRTRFRQFTEGWGLTFDGRELVLSDGSSRLYFLDPETMIASREIEVRDTDGPVDNLNELEYVDGEIWANVWFESHLVRIAPTDGRVLGRIDLSELVDPGLRDPDAVLNGIAYDPDRGRIFVTGKLWPRLYEIRVRSR